MDLELDADLREELEEEAMLQGFDDAESYVRWIIANRPMSDRATEQAPAVASRVDELEERVTILERQLNLDSGTPSGDLEAEGSSGGASLDADIDPDIEDSDEKLSEELMAEVTEVEEEDAAEDDDIADAIDDVALDDS